MRKSSEFRNYLKTLKKHKIAFMTGAGTLLATVPAFAEGEPVVTDTYKTVLTALTGAISVADVAAILGVCVTAGVGFFFLWFGARKAVSSFVAALKGGRVKI